MSQLLFEQHLLDTKHRGLTPLNEDQIDEDVVTEILTAFAESFDDDDDDLETTFENFCEANDISEDDTDILKNIIVEASRQVGGEGTDNDIKSLLKHLAQPFPKAETRYPNQEGMTPETGETSTKGFLKKLPVAAHPDPYGNKGFSADHYKAFDRAANRYGHNYSYANDFNNQKPSWPLANPELNVNSGATDQKESVFEAVDAVGLGAKVHWRVMNKLTGQYVTKQIEQTQAEAIAADLNREYEQLLSEHWYHHSTIGNYHILQGAGVHGGEWGAHEQGGYDRLSFLFNCLCENFSAASFRTTTCPTISRNVSLCRDAIPIWWRMVVKHSVCAKPRIEIGIRSGLWPTKPPTRIAISIVR